MLVDSHCHLDFQQLQSDIEGVLQRAKQADVRFLHTIGTRIADVEKLLLIAEQHSSDIDPSSSIEDSGLQIFCSVGVHPLNVMEKLVVDAAALIKLSEHRRVIGIGETGLDYRNGGKSRATQRQSFINHIRAAQQTGLPLVIHTREADLDTVTIMKELIADGPFCGVIHCFTASEWLAESCLEMGLYLSASGIITFKNAQNINNVFKHTHIDRILIETDSPFLAPVPKRGQSNEPSYLVHIAKHLAKLRDCSYNEVVQTTTKNFFTLFNKADLWIRYTAGK